MLRRVFTVLSALSLVLCVATVVLWVRSGTTVDAAVRRGGYPSDGGVTHFSTSVISLNGKLGLDWQRAEWPAHTTGVPVATPWRWESDPALPAGDLGDWLGDADRIGPGSFSPDDRRTRTAWFWKHFGGGVQRLRIGGPGYPRLVYTQVVLPHWLLAAATATLPACRLLPRLSRTCRRRRRSRLRLCLSCGYDLRATTGVCPECGAAASGTSASAAGDAV